AAAIVWVGVGDALPGGRWAAVHLFTLGVVSNLVVALTHHFAQTVLHTPARSARHGRFLLLNAGVVLLVAGLPTGLTGVFLAGAVALTAAVCWLYVDLRRARRQALAARFAFVVRGYERACGAFLHGALLGGLLGAGVLSGAWYGAGRIAHLHVNVLGWGGLTLLATVVFFGPTVMRTRIEEGADDAAVPALRHAATGLTVATVALLLTGVGGAGALAAQLLAAGGLAVYAAGATVVCLGVLRAGKRSHPSAHARLLQAACGWLVLAVWADVLVVATGQLSMLDALGVLLLLGVLGQAILGALGYLAPMVRGTDPASRTAIRRRLETFGRLRPLALNLGVALIVVAAMLGASAGMLGAVAARSGWLLVVAVVGSQAVLTARSQPARRATVATPTTREDQA
ncbi:MAG: hypothetical protein WD080_00380, partial [Egibacteraceae bacterium]